MQTLPHPPPINEEIATNMPELKSLLPFGFTYNEGGGREDADDYWPQERKNGRAYFMPRFFFSMMTWMSTLAAQIGQT